MAISCKECGAMLTDRDAFCTNCGAQRDTPAESTSGRRFCTKCGSTLTKETKFCTQCGAPIDAGANIAASPSSQPPVSSNVSSLVTPISRSTAQTLAATSTGSSPAASAPAVASGAASTNSSSIPKVAIVAAGVVLLLIVAIFVGVTSVAHHVREKVFQVEASSKIDKTTAAPSAAVKARKGRSGQGSVEDLIERLEDLRRVAPDQKTSAAVDALVGKLENLDLAVRRNPNDAAAVKALNDSLAGIAATATALTPAISAGADAALTPPPAPSGPPMVPVAGTGDPKHDWPLEYERTVGGPEADLLVRTGDINNLGFGWPSNFDPFSGKSTPPHVWPSILQIPPQAPPGTDRIMIGMGVTPVHMHVQRTVGEPDHVMVDSVTEPMPTSGDGYSGSLEACYAIASIPSNVLQRFQKGNHIQVPSDNDDTFFWVSTQTAAQCVLQRQLTMPTPIVLDVGELPSKISTVLVQIFVDDFQAPVYHSYFQVSLNGTRIPSFEYVVNSLDQSGPIGKLVTMRLLPEYWPLLKAGTVKLLIDDPTTHARDGYAVDFVRILVNPHKFKYQVSLTATVTDADKHTPIPGATVSVGTTSTAADQQGKCELNDIPAGLVVATASAPGYDENSVPVDLSAGQSGHADIQLHQHQESTAALEQSIAQTGSATIYGIHFDTGSSKLRADSMPALNAVLGLINSRSGSNWIIAGHTDNQGSDALNIPLSKARAASVIAWLTAHGIAASRLEPQGFGSTRPVADNATANGRFLNRRVEVALAK